MILTPQIDPFIHPPSGPTAFMTERNYHEVRCGLCARPVYVDDQTYSSGQDSGMDAPYRCEICAEEYSDVAWKNH